MTPTIAKLSGREAPIIKILRYSVGMTTCRNCSHEWDIEELGTDCPSCGIPIPGSDNDPHEDDDLVSTGFTPGIESSGWGAQPSIGEGWPSDLPDPPEEVEGSSGAQPPSSEVPSHQPPPTTPTDPGPPPQDLWGQSARHDAPPAPPLAPDPLSTFGTTPEPAKGMSTGSKVGIAFVVGGLVLVFGVLAAVVAVVRVGSNAVDEFNSLPEIVFEEADAGTDEFEFADEIGFVDLVVGECFNQSSLPSAVPCDGPHEYEIFAAIQLDKELHPTWEEAWLATSCTSEFERFVDFDYIESQLWYEVARPSESVWFAGDHDIRCLVYQPSSDFSGVESLVGSVEGASY